MSLGNKIFLGSDCVIMIGDVVAILTTKAMMELGKWFSEFSFDPTRKTNYFCFRYSRGILPGRDGSNSISNSLIIKQKINNVLTVSSGLEKEHFRVC